MNKYINRVIALFAKGRDHKTTLSQFHDWLINDNQEKEQKEEALHDLWDLPSAMPSEDAYRGYISFLSKKYARTSNPTKPIRKIFKLTRWSVAAVAVIFLLSAGLVYSGLQNPPRVSMNFVEHYSKIGEVNSITLPDGSMVETNSTTVFVYPEDFGTTARTLYLTGEANFKVVKNADIPFIVKSKGFSTTALGTEFNVTSYPDEEIYKTTLISGSVKVNQDSNQDLAEVLKVGQQFIYNKLEDTYLVQESNLDEETAWQKGEMALNGLTIKEILKVLERNYNVVFHYNSKRATEDEYNFRFKKGTSLEDVLNVMKNVADNMDYKLTDDICYIYVK